MDPVDLLAFPPVGRRPRRAFGSAVARHSFGTLGAALWFVVGDGEKKVAARRRKAPSGRSSPKGNFGSAVARHSFKILGAGPLGLVCGAREREKVK